VKIAFSCRSSFLLLLLVLFERLLPLGLMPFCLKLTGLYIVLVDLLLLLFLFFSFRLDNYLIWKLNHGLLCSENKANLWIDLAIKFSSDVLVSFSI